MVYNPNLYQPQSKRPRKITKEWWDRAVLKATTQDDIVQELQQLKKDNPEKWLRIILDSVPKVNINENNGLVVRIMLDGITQKVPVQGRVIEQAALNAHTDPVHDDL